MEGTDNQRPEYKHELSAKYRGVPRTELDGERPGTEAGGFRGPVELEGL
jgi:hypothetical protein